MDDITKILKVNEVDTDEDMAGIPEYLVNETAINEFVGIVATPNDGPLNLRSNPDKKSTSLTSIPAGSKIKYKKFSDEWAIVRYNGVEGYAMMKFIK